MRTPIALVAAALALSLSACESGGNFAGPTPTRATVTATATVTREQSVTIKVTTSPLHRTARRATSFGNGTFEVGVDVQPGRYRNAGSIYGNQAPCVAFQSHKPNDIKTFVNSSNTTGPGIIDLTAGLYVNVTSCKTWRKG
jgi:hypothetical protein